MKKTRDLIIIMIIVLILLIIGIGIILITLKKENRNIEENVNSETTTSEEQVIERVKDNKLFYTIENCIKKYEAYLNLDYEKQLTELNYPSLAAIYKIETKEEKDNALLGFLDEEYIEKYNIKQNNLDNYVKETKNEETNINVLQINKLIDKSTNIKAYSVYAKKTTEENEKTVYYIIKMDDDNGAFVIYPLEDSSYKDIDQITVENNTKAITKNDRNTIVESDMNDGQIATKYFQDYKEMLVNNTEEAYNRLDNDYKNKKFGSLEKFNEYVQSKKDDIQMSQIYQYLKEDNEYVAKDRYENLYVFDEEAPNDYKVKLDTYTIITDKFKEEYESADDIKKVQLQLDVFRQMINDKDFSAAYNILGDKFKENYFQTQEEFEKYVKDNTFKYNQINFDDIQQQGKLYVCKVNFTNLVDEVEEEKKDINKYEWTFIVQLTDVENFKLSFSIE